MMNRRSFSFRYMTWSLLSWVLIFSACSTPQKENLSQVMSNAPRHSAAPYVLLISIDGFRYDYVQRYHPPNIEKFAKEGIRAKSLKPIFPSKTFPNHYSIITGLYADSHGIVSNNFMEPSSHRIYKLGDPSSTNDGSWYGGIPLWSLAAQQNMVSASLFWVGSEAEIAGFRPSYYLKFDRDLLHDKRVDQIVEWLKLPEAQRPHFLTLYFHEVDLAGHKFGSRSKEVKEAVMMVDDTFGKLLGQIADLHLPLHIVLVSDHGMQDLDRKKIEYPDSYASLASFTILGAGPMMNLYLKEGRESSEISSVIKALQKKAKHFKVYTRDTMPKAFHYSKSDRVGDLVLVANAPYSLELKGQENQMPKGDHGYDPNKTKAVHGIFYAQGPLWKSKVRVPTFQNIHIYPFLAETLGLNLPLELDGDPGVLKKLFLEGP